MFRKLKNVLAGFDAKEDALKDQAASETPPGYERVRTLQGHLAHLKHPQFGILCGWSAVWAPADPVAAALPDVQGRCRGRG